MGNRAVITTPEKKIGVYVHWNGGRDTIEPLLEYCRLQGYRSPDADDYGFARMVQVLANFFGGGLSIGVGPYKDLEHAGGDNGVYVIKDWEIVDRIYPYDGFVEQAEYDFDEMLRAFDKRMPEPDRLGGYLDAQEVPTKELRIGDEVYKRVGPSDTFELYPVMGFKEGVPYLALYDHDGDWSWNPNNYVREETCRVRRAMEANHA